MNKLLVGLLCLVSAKTFCSESYTLTVKNNSTRQAVIYFVRSNGQRRPQAVATIEPNNSCTLTDSPYSGDIDTFEIDTSRYSIASGQRHTIVVK